MRHFYSRLGLIIMLTFLPVFSLAYACVYGYACAGAYAYVLVKTSL